jgi:tyramine---L-glutamate ligase
LRLLVYEHVSGGGCAGQTISPSVLSEGFGMLRSIVSDFKSAGHEVTVLLDDQLSRLNPPMAADCTIPVFYPQEAEKILVNAAKKSGAVYVIAPETQKTLQSLVEFVEHLGKVSLNCDANAIQKVADKTVLYETLKKNGIPTPNTAVINVDVGLPSVKQVINSKFSYPVVFKPVNGVSCGGLSIVKGDAQVEQAIDKIKTESAAKHFLVQQFLDGEASSVSVLCTGEKAFAVSLNRQNVKVAGPEAVSSYEGGTVPFDHPLKHEAFKMAEKVVESFTGLRGYVGVDLVLAKDKPFVVDVNPRLTTSYVGLREIASFNVAEALINAVLNRKLPPEREINGFIYFSKVETAKPSVSAFEKAAKISEVVSPPFPLDDTDRACSLVAGQGESLDNSRLKFEEAKKRLLNIMTRGK